MARGIHIGTSLGDYIHYHQENYYRYGLGTKLNSKPEDARSVYQRHINLLREQAHYALGAEKAVVKQNIEQALNFFRSNYNSNLDKDSGWNEEDLEKIEAAIQQAVMNRINIDGIDIQWESLRAYNISGEKGLRRSGGFTLRRRLSEKGPNQVESIQMRLDILDQTLKDLENIVKMPKLASLKDVTERLWAQWNNILKSVDSKDVRMTYGHETIYIDPSNNFVKTLNTVWNSFKEEVNAYITGKIGEYYAAIAVEAANLKGTKITDEILKDFIDTVTAKTDQQIGAVGTITSKAVLDKKNFAVTGGKKTSFQNNTFSNFAGEDYKITATQDKVDLELTLKGLNFPIKASVKNYNLNHNVTLHSGVSIIALTQEYANFMNHYLNITARVPGTRQSYNNSMLRPMNEALVITLALKALAGNITKIDSGGTLSQNAQADVFIVNGSNGLYKVFFIDDLIDTIIKNPFNSVVIDGLAPNTTWPQQWITPLRNIGGNRSYSYQTAYARINKLISQLHNFKLHIALKPRVLKA